MQTARAWMKEGATSGVRTLLAATCFDITEALPLVERTYTGLRATLHGEWSNNFSLEHGGLLFLPSKHCWIEIFAHGRRAGFFIHEVESYLAFVALDADRRPTSGFFEFSEDGERFTIRGDVRQKAEAEYTENLIAGGFFIASALMLINATRGVEQQTSAPHKGFVREMRRALGPVELQPSHVIRLSTAPQAQGATPGDVGHSGPKAHHFCRSHLRRLPNGGTTRVRAHWRGDPSLGVCRGDYQVTA